LEAKSNDGGASEYDRWLDAFDFAYRNARSFRDGVCPHCGNPALRLVFVVKEAGDKRATAVFWCDHCLRGLLPLTTLVPDGAETVVQGNETIPNYTIVPDQ
jgi:hypothetical protein